MHIRALNNREEAPFQLLLMADPSQELVEDYLNRGECYIAEDNDGLVGVYVLLPTRPETVELVNIAVSESEQGKGIGKRLVMDAIQRAKRKGYKTMEIGTGNSSIGQLALYQKCGFRITGVDRDFFIRHYEEDIIENGIVCRDMIRLAQDLEKKGKGINMKKNIYIIRHCEAEGQPPESPLTVKGHEQAMKLADFLTSIEAERIISSPFLRALQSIEPFARNKSLDIETDSRLGERVLSSALLPDWLDKLEATFHDLDLKYEGGESSNEALERILAVVNEIRESESETTVIVSHGGIISLLLNHYDKNFGFEQWKSLSNPDVYLLNITEESASFTRLWES